MDLARCYPPLHWTLTAESNSSSGQLSIQRYQGVSCSAAGNGPMAEMGVLNAIFLLKQ